MRISGTFSLKAHVSSKPFPTEVKTTSLAFGETPSAPTKARPQLCGQDMKPPKVYSPEIRGCTSYATPHNKDEQKTDKIYTDAEHKRNRLA